MKRFLAALALVASLWTPRVSAQSAALDNPMMETSLMQKQDSMRREAETKVKKEILDPILDYWANLYTQPDQYEPGRWGPRSARTMLAEDGFVWRRP